MSLRLSDRLRIETEAVGDGMVTRAFVGASEVPLSRAILDALLAVAGGRRVDSAVVAELLALGVLVERTPTTRPAPADADLLALSPTCALDVELAAPPGPGGRPVRPLSSLPIALSVPPARLGPLQQLAGTLREAWFFLVSAAHSRGRLVDPGEAQRVLEAIAREAVAGGPAGEVLAIVGEGPLRLAPRAPLQDDGLHYPIASLGVWADRETRLSPAVVTVPMGEDTAACGALLGRVAAGASAADVAAHMTRPAAIRLWQALWERRLVGAAPAAPRLADLAPGTVAHLGHATLLANLGGETILIDPWLPPASRADPVAPPSFAELPPLAGVFVTHHHWDHVNPETLLKLDKRVPVYVPRQPGDRAVGPRTEALLAYLGFERVAAFGHGDALDLGDGGRISAVPFFGEDPTRIRFAGNVYVLEHGGGAALVHVDSGPDLDGASTVSSGLGDELRAAHGALSPVFATRRQERGTMVEHTWEFLLRPADEWVRPTENCATGATFLADLCRAVASPCLVLYSEGGADWYPPGTDFLRRATPSALQAAHEYLWDSLDDIRAAVAAAGAATYLASPFDRYTIGGGPL